MMTGMEKLDISSFSIQILSHQRRLVLSSLVAFNMVLYGFDYLIYNKILLINIFTINLHKVHEKYFYFHYKRVYKLYKEKGVLF